MAFSYQSRKRRRRSTKADIAIPGSRAKIAHAIQPKLRVGKADDPQEKEADAVADKVMRAPNSESGDVAIQRKCAECDEEQAQRSLQLQRAELQREAVPEEEKEKEEAQRSAELQRQAEPEEKEEEKKEEEVQAKGAEGGAVSESLSQRIQNRRGGGHPLPTREKTFFESRFGRDFSSVRVHADPESSDISRQINARAFTLGNDIFFGEGEYRPGSEQGRHLMAHELTHTIQQGGGSTASRTIRCYRSPGSPNFGVNDVPGTLEEKAFDNKAPDPYIEKITINFNSTDKVDGQTVPKGTLKAVYASNGAKSVPANISGVPILGGYPSEGLTDKGTGMKVHRIEGYGYHHVYPPKKSERLGQKWPEAKYYKPALGGSASMSYALFFSGSQAIHQGSLTSASLACVHVASSEMQQMNYHSRKGVTEVDVNYSSTALEKPCCERYKATGRMVSNPCKGQDPKKCP